MKRYIYKGPVSGITLDVGTKDKPDEKEIMFYDGKEYDLPEKHPYIKTLVAIGHLTEVQQDESKQIVKSDKSKKEAQNAG